MSERPAPCACLVVLDGWGMAEPGPGNAVSLAHTPVFDRLWSSYPHTTLTAYGEAVGLPKGQMGNSEVGHLNLGAGAVVKQDLVRIGEAIASGALAANAVLREAMRDAPRIHLLGLVSDGGVHSSLEHLRALVALAVELAPTADVVVHAFTDGRDTLPHSGAAFLAELDAARVRVGSVVGRYWAMDRDRRWERTQRAYDLLVHGRGGRAPHGGEAPSGGGAPRGGEPYHADSGEQAVRDAYERGETDEFIEPTLVGEEARIRPGDSVVCFNFRPDRMRELVRALAEPGFAEIDRGGAPPVRRLATRTEYEEGWPYPVAFAPERPKATLAAVLAAAGARQLHVAETEKYPHVTYFFNGGEETPYAGERRELAPSPRDVPTYDHKPQMSAREAAERFVAAWSQDGGYRFGIVNFANADMVGHTGVIPAAVKAVEAVDECLGLVLEAVASRGGVAIVTADHGNADHMLEPDGSPNTAHSLNPVPLIVTQGGLSLREGGILADVAPTVLELLGIAQPRAMTGTSLLER